jgi:hypothetical protein
MDQTPADALSAAVRRHKATREAIAAQAAEIPSTAPVVSPAATSPAPGPSLPDDRGTR